MPTFRRSCRRSLPRWPDTLWPSSRTVPPLMGIRWLMARRRVDFPDPEGPITETNSPSPTVKDTSFSACTPFG